MDFIILALWGMDTTSTHGTFYISNLQIWLSYMFLPKRWLCKKMGLHQGSDDREWEEIMVVKGNLVLIGLVIGHGWGLSLLQELRYFNLGPWIINGIVHQNTKRDKSSQKERKWIQFWFWNVCGTWNIYM